MHEVFDFDWYGPNILRLQSKGGKVVPFKFLQYQIDFNRQVKEIERAGHPVRMIVLKARQCGLSTLTAGMFTHKMQTIENFKTIMLADKAGRTDEVFSIYDRFVNLTPPAIRPMIAVQNSREIMFDNPNQLARAKYPGMGSGLVAETARDPNAGRSGTRRAAHMTEFAFYRYAAAVNEGIQNSIPLIPGTFIIKESTANGMGGDGETFFLEWEAAMRGDTDYQPFFVSWFKVDDYALTPTPGFRKTPEEIDLQKLCPGITDANLMWRRRKIREYVGGKASIFTPEDRFKQDFPSYPEEAFLNSGRPVFDTERLKRHLQRLRTSPENPLNFRLAPTPPRPMLSMFMKDFTMWEAPKEGERYSIGADIAEGLEEGDASSACVMTKDGRQVAIWHGHLDPDLFGKLLVEIGTLYNKALLVPEMNNMGYATLAAIKSAGYLRVYMREIKDTLSDEEQEKMGWRTTSSNKLAMLALLVTAYRDEDVLIRDPNLLSEMQKVVRESDGDVVLNGRDRVVAACLALEGRKQLYQAGKITDPNAPKKPLQTERRDYYRTGRPK